MPSTDLNGRNHDARMRGVWISEAIALGLIVYFFITNPSASTPPLWVAFLIFAGSLVLGVLSGAIVHTLLKNPQTALYWTVFSGALIHLIALSIPMLNSPGAGMWIPIAALTTIPFSLPVIYGTSLLVAKYFKAKDSTSSFKISSEFIILSYMKTFLVLWLCLWPILIVIGLWYD